MAIEFSERVRRLPVYPVAGAYDLGDDVAMLASNESPDPPLPAVVAAAQRAVAGANRYPDPSNSALRGALSRRYGVPGARIAIGNGSCDILLAAGEALLEPGAELVYAWPSFSVYPHLAAASGARAITVPLDGDQCHDLDAMAAEITAATRLVVVCNPNNPTSTALPFEDIAAFVGEGPAPHRADRRRGLLRVQPPRRPRHDARPARQALEPRAPADVLEGLRAVRAARRLRAVRLRGLPARRRPGPPAVLLQRRRAGGGSRGAQAPGRGRRPRRAGDRRARRGRVRAQRARDRAGAVAGELLLVRPAARTPTRPPSSRGSPSAASSSARAARWVARARCV